MSKAPSARSPENAAAAAAWRPQVLDRMILLCQAEADRIEVWQRSDPDGAPIPEARWDAGQRAKRKLFLDIAQLVFLVQMVEPEFKKMVRVRLGDRRAAKAKEAPADGNDDAPADTAAVAAPAD